MQAASFIDGRFARPGRPREEIVRRDPGSTDRVVSRCLFSHAAVEEAVAAASAAYLDWAAAPTRERLAALRRFALLARKDEGRLARTLALETGKPLWEARLEVAALSDKVDITIRRGLPLVRSFRAGAGTLCRFHPRGVMAVIGPFNMPLHLPNGHIVPALATGNTVVLKPSELAPASATLYAGLMRRAGVPPGVFNLIQGDGRVGRLLASHDDVNGVLFTGSYRAGLWIKRATLDRPGKILALEMGGKNAAVVFGDADLSHAVAQCALGAFMTTGQRCTSTGRIMVQRTILDEFVERLAAIAGRLAIGHGLERGVFMGPLASEKVRRKFRSFARKARAAGAEAILASKKPLTRRRGFYVTPSVHLLPAESADGEYAREEVFGPDVAITSFDDLEEAIELASASEYGLAISVFTRRRKVFEEFFRRCRVGVLNFNRATIGASSELPFGGLGRSGNDRPAALFSPVYCTYPVATLEGTAARPTYPPGFPAKT